MIVDGLPSRGRPRKIWIGVKDDMKIKGASMEMTIEENGRRKHVVPTPHSKIRGR
jgi:hypothetical protein